jgi:hypothetical protein
MREEIPCYLKLGDISGARELIKFTKNSKKIIHIFPSYSSYIKIFKFNFVIL